MSATKKGKGAGAGVAVSRRVLDPTTRAQQQVHRFYAEVESMRKANQMQVEGLRSSGRQSENLLRRAMQLDSPVFSQQSILAGSSSSAPMRTSSTRHIASEEKEMVEDLVGGGALCSGVLLSRGAVPSVIPGKYSALAGVGTPSDWAAAAHRQKELKVALRELEEEMKASEASVMSQTRAISDGTLSATKFTHSDTANPITNLVTVIKPGSNVMGSSFRWQGTQAKSLKEEQFSWPSDYEHKFSSWPVGATKYGPLSHECDVPGGSVYVQRGKGRLSKLSKKR